MTIGLIMEQAPVSEFQARVGILQQAMALQDIALALVRLHADLYYYTGVVVDGFLAVAPAGAPLLLLRRPQERGISEHCPWPWQPYRDIKDLPGLIGAAGLDQPGTLGLELDGIPAQLYQRLTQKLFTGRPVRDLSPLIRHQRMVKSAYELARIRRAAAMLDEVYAQAPAIIRPGLTEFELAAALEYQLRLAGHQGLVRLRNRDLEMFFGHVMSGEAGLVPAYVNTPSGGLGPHPAFPQGASHKLLAPGEPISIDYAGVLNGYTADLTRLYVLGDLPAAAWRAWEVVEELYYRFAAEARPGAMPGDLYDSLLAEVRAYGLEDYFMGSGADRVSFVGHGVGLELDEYPVIAPRFPHQLEEDMVVAFEPKFFLPGIGMIGQEDTGRITPAGVEWLTQSPRQVTIIGG